MAITKAPSSAFSAQAGSATSSAVPTAGAYSATLFVAITQVGTATTAANFSISYSLDGSTYTTGYNSPTYLAGLAAAVYSFAVAIPVEVQAIKVVYTAQAGGSSSSITADVGELTAL